MTSPSHIHHHIYSDKFRAHLSYNESARQSNEVLFPSSSPSGRKTSSHHIIRILMDPSTASLRRRRGNLFLYVTVPFTTRSVFVVSFSYSWIYVEVGSNILRSRSGFSIEFPTMDGRVTICCIYDSKRAEIMSYS